DADVRNVRHGGDHTAARLQQPGDFPEQRAGIFDTGEEVGSEHDVESRACGLPLGVQQLDVSDNDAFAMRLRAIAAFLVRLNADHAAAARRQYSREWLPGGRPPPALVVCPRP